MGKLMETPFSNGTSAMMWMENNCDRCVKAYRPKVEGNWPSFDTMKQYCSIGKECKLKLHIDIGFISSEVPKEIIDQIGRNENGWISDQCMLFSDNEDDGYKPKKRPKPDGSGPNQMIMPFSIEEILKQSLQTV